MQPPIGVPGAMPPRIKDAEISRPTSTLKHIVVVIQENRTFNDLFAKFPGADGTTRGRLKNTSGRGYTYIALKEVNLDEHCDFGHGYQGFLKNYDEGAMDGFGLVGNKCNGNHRAAYQYVNPSQIQPYWDMAQQYVLGDHMFQTQGSGSFTAHQDLIAGATIIDPYKTVSLVDFPTHTPWGCDAPPGSTTPKLIWTGSQIVSGQGPFPCLGYSTLRDLLDAKGVTWRYYSPPILGHQQPEGRLWNAFDAIDAVRHSKEWGTNVTFSNALIFKDITKNQLPAVSWVIPDREESDHPQSPFGDDGPSWVASIVNAIGTTAYWNNTAIVVVWDDWGGFYDQVSPPLTDHWGGLGFRVPMIVVSAYAREHHKGQPGYITHTNYEFGSILKFIEHTFDLGTLHTTDERATGIGDCFDFTQSPRTFTKIPSSKTTEYFLHTPPSQLPVDTE
ncbi:MAG: alkaline phosphatase family protein [Candidatus Cybelea sp.]